MFLWHPRFSTYAPDMGKVSISKNSSAILAKDGSMGYWLYYAHPVVRPLDIVVLDGVINLAPGTVRREISKYEDSGRARWLEEDEEEMVHILRLLARHML